MWAQRRPLRGPIANPSGSSPPGLASSLNGVAECSRIVSHASVPCDDRHQRGRFGQHFCGGQMHGVERPNGLHGEGAADTRQDIIRHPDDVATAREDLECTCRGAFVRRAQPPAGTGAKDGAGSLRERQRGRDPRPWRANRCSGRRIALQQRRDQRTRFDVARRQPDLRRRSAPPVGESEPRDQPARYASPRSLSIKAAAVPAGNRMSGQSSSGSPPSSAGRMTPVATKSS